MSDLPLAIRLKKKWCLKSPEVEADQLDTDDGYAKIKAKDIK
jgi:hypothetical protein